MARRYKITVKGYADFQSNPQKEVHDWVGSFPAVWEKVDVDVEQRLKSTSAKGGIFERDFCKQLSYWISEGTDKDIFWRTAGSGSFATRKKSELQIGDVSCFPEKYERYGWFTDATVIELRNRELALGKLFSTPFQWLEDLLHKCIKSNVSKIPFVIMKSEGALCAFTVLVAISRLGIDKYFQFGDTFVMFDFRDMWLLRPEAVKNYWRGESCPS